MALKGVAGSKRGREAGRGGWNLPWSFVVYCGAERLDRSTSQIYANSSDGVAAHMPATADRIRVSHLGRRAKGRRSTPEGRPGRRLAPAEARAGGAVPGARHA